MDWIVSKTVQLTAKMGYVTMSTALAFAQMERMDLLFAATVSYILIICSGIDYSIYKDNMSTKSYLFLKQLD